MSGKKNNNVTLTYHNQPLSVLSELIKKRVKWLGTAAKDAVYAGAIDVCKSLRADTRLGAYRRKTKVTDTGLLAYYSRTDGCWRGATEANGKGGRNRSIKLRYVRYRGVQPKDRHIYLVETERGKQYYVGCRAAKEAQNIEKENAKKRLAKYKGLARTALTVVMGDMAKHTSISAPGAAITKARQLAKFTPLGTGDDIGVRVTSGIDYGKLALKSGSVDTSVKKAANKIAGMLKKAMSRNPLHKVNIPTPFPEVKKRK